MDIFKLITKTATAALAYLDFRDNVCGRRRAGIWCALSSPLLPSFLRDCRGRGDVVVRLLAPYVDEPGSAPGRVVPGFSRMGIVSDDTADRRVFSGISRFLRPYSPALLHSHNSSSSALKSLDSTQPLSLLLASERNPNFFSAIIDYTQPTSGEFIVGGGRHERAPVAENEASFLLRPDAYEGQRERGTEIVAGSDVCRLPTMSSPPPPLSIFYQTEPHLIPQHGPLASVNPATGDGCVCVYVCVGVVLPLIETRSQERVRNKTKEERRTRASCRGAQCPGNAGRRERRDVPEIHRNTAGSGMLKHSRRDNNHKEPANCVKLPGQMERKFATSRARSNRKRNTNTSEASVACPGTETALDARRNLATARGSSQRQFLPVRREMAAQRYRRGAELRTSAQGDVGNQAHPEVYRSAVWTPFELLFLGWQFENLTVCYAEELLKSYCFPPEFMELLVRFRLRGRFWFHDGVSIVACTSVCDTAHFAVNSIYLPSGCTLSQGRMRTLVRICEQARLYKQAHWACAQGRNITERIYRILWAAISVGCLAGRLHGRAHPMTTIRHEFHTTTRVSISIGTLSTEAHRLGYFGRAAAHEPHITTSNKARRLRWCLERRNWTLEQWKSVLWSDESRFTLFRSDGRVWVWRLLGERLLPECVVPTRKFGSGGVMVWGCFTAFGVGPLVFVRGSMNTEAYCNILDNEMLPTLWRFYEMDPCYFQGDNARCQVSRATMQWFADNNVRRLDWHEVFCNDHRCTHFTVDSLYLRVCFLVGEMPSVKLRSRSGATVRTWTEDYCTCSGMETVKRSWPQGLTALRPPNRLGRGVTPYRRKSKPGTAAHPRPLYHGDSEILVLSDKECGLAGVLSIPLVPLQGTTGAGCRSPPGPSSRVGISPDLLQHAESTTTSTSPTLRSGHQREPHDGADRSSRRWNGRGRPEAVLATDVVENTLTPHR
ncbi:hypothetical protein PR048_004304 [Dryococelus australis]|uniref:Transposase n=1 Tax=Dryococelus australis TaxID=614101 RepID=A0ABQ9I532_9NEOP|nr:hypothetical protein PR048_004304 [Dryococelus australis]